MKYCLWESCRQCTKDAVDQNTFEFVLLSDGAKVPQKATLGSTGFDVYSPREVTIHAQKTMKIPLNLSISPPEGTYTRSAARSSLATRHQIICPADDVIDPDYTGCIHMCLTNLSDRDYTIQKHQMIGSPVFEHYCDRPRGKMTKSLKGTQRGSNGFSSSGKF
jgi:dUTP pyrophosphatase